MSQIERELKRGTLEMLLLHLLAEEPTWGYELTRRLEERSDGRFRIKEGTLYPVLYRLQDAGQVETEWSQPKRGVPRKYYRLTTTGRSRLVELATAWRDFATAIDAVLAAPSRKEDA